MARRVEDPGYQRPRRSGNVRPNQADGARRASGQNRFGVPLRTILDIEAAVVPPAYIDRAQRITNDIVQKAGSMSKQRALQTAEDKMQLVFDIWNMMFDKKGQYGFDDKFVLLFSHSLWKGSLDTFSTGMIFGVIANELDLPIHLVLLPGVICVRWEDQQTRFNFLKGQFISDESFKRMSKMPESCITKGIYLKPMTRDEIEALILSNRASARISMVIQETYRFDTSRALADMLLALKKSPKAPYVHINLANVYAMQGKINQARDHYRAAVELDPTSAPIFYALATVEYVLGNEKGFINAYSKAIAIDPEVVTQGNLNEIYDILARLKPDQKYYEA